MADAKPGFIQTIRSFPATFWVANTMEIFERMAWYGFYAVSSLYITGPVETGGLGFTSEERGQLQAIVPFFLYLFPVVTGALADRYGYKKMFIIAYVCMVIFYYALGQFRTFPTFLGAFMLVAVAAAIFKPVVVGTVARVTNANNSATGFGIFYMMVNIGGFLGPLVAGAVRGISWRYVFIACSTWAAINLLICILLYRDPSTEAKSAERRTLGKVARDMVEVLGNLRFGLTVFVVLIALMVANQEVAWFSWLRCAVFIGVWLALNFLWDAAMPSGSGNPKNPISQGRPFYLKRTYCSNWRFALFLLIMSGFWTSFNQIFITMPEYIRDFTDTRSMVDLGRRVSPALSGFARSVVQTVGLEKQAAKINSDAFLNALAAVEETEVLQEFDKLVRRARDVDSMVPREPPTAASNSKTEKSVLERLRKLLEDSKLDEVSRSRIQGAISSLEDSENATTQRTSPAPASDGSLNRLVRTEAALDAARRLLSVFSAVEPFESELVNNVAQRAKELFELFTRRAAIDAAEKVASSFERAKNTEKLPDDPSLSQQDLAELARLAGDVNATDAREPLEVIDFVDSARTMLQYKVRIQASVLAQAVIAVSTLTETVADDVLDAAVKTINKRLENKGIPTFADDETEALRASLRNLALEHGPLVPRNALLDACDDLTTKARRIDAGVLATGVRDVAYRPVIWDHIDAGRQVNPEHIVNIDALSIVLLQVFISFLMARFHRFTTMIVGMVIAAVGIGLSAIAGGTMIGPAGGLLIVVIAGIVVFAIGEMMASPTSQEYVGRIAPRDKVAVYMGYYFVAIALGNLFGGILSGQLYGKLARDAQRPDLMWLVFGVLMLLTAVVFVLYNKFALPRHAADSLTQE